METNMKMLNEARRRESVSDLTVEKHINVFLNSMGLESDKTKESYETDIRQFFKMTRDKSIKELSIDDLVFHKSDVETYQIELSKKYMASTVNRKIASMKSLYEKLEEYDYPVEARWFKIKRLNMSESDSYDILEWHEIQKMMNLVRNHTKGLMKSLFIEFAVKTSFRKKELLNLTWDSFTRHSEEIVLVTVIGKGKKKETMPIKNEFYERLLEIKNGDKEYVFDFYGNGKEANRMMDKLVEEMGINDGRYITVHSLKGSGMAEVDIITGGDIKQIQKQGHHSDELTSLKFYMNRRRNWEEMACLEIGEDFDLSPLEVLSKEELLQVISEGGRALQAQVLNQMKKRKKDRK